MTGQGRGGEAIQAGLAAVAAEPLRESARRVLIRAYRAEGNVADAVRQFESFRTVLRDELGVRVRLHIVPEGTVPRTEVGKAVRLMTWDKGEPPVPGL